MGPAHTIARAVCQEFEQQSRDSIRSFPPLLISWTIGSMLRPANHKKCYFDQSVLFVRNSEWYCVAFCGGSWLFTSPGTSWISKEAMCAFQSSRSVFWCAPEDRMTSTISRLESRQSRSWWKRKEFPIVAKFPQTILQWSRTPASIT